MAASDSYLHLARITNYSSIEIAENLLSPSCAFPTKVHAGAELSKLVGCQHASDLSIKLSDCIQTQLVLINAPAIERVNRPFVLKQVYVGARSFHHNISAGLQALSRSMSKQYPLNIKIADKAKVQHRDAASARGVPSI